MGYDIVDAFTDIKELNNRMNALIAILDEKGLLPKEEQDVKQAD